MSFNTTVQPQSQPQPQVEDVWRNKVSSYLECAPGRIIRLCSPGDAGHTIQQVMS